MNLTRAFLFCAIVALFFSCGGNRMKNNEKALKKQILTEEEKLANDDSVRLKREQQLTDSIAKLPKGFRFKEVRNVDPNMQPLVIDIAGSLNNIRDFKLSDVASDINYIRMDAVPDANLPRDLKYKYYLTDNYIVAINLYGTHLFSKEGKFIRTVVKNELTGVEYNAKEDRIRFWSDYTLKGGGTSVWARGDNLFYLYSNNMTGQKYIMEFDCSQNQPAPDMRFDPENQNKISGLGQQLIDLNHGNTTPPPPRKHQGIMSIDPDGMYQRIGIFSSDRNTYISNLHGKNMLGIIGRHGDTLSTFTKLEQLKNYTKMQMRGTDWGTQYEKGGNLFLRSDFNDTIFQVIPPNRLQPVYVLNLGKYKVSKQEGIDPDVSLEGKIIPQDWADAKNYIFMTFTKDNYDCPNTRKSKSVKIYHALFSKGKHQLSIVESEPTDYTPQILRNDIDGGIPVWPQSYMVDKNGEILLSLKGSELKSEVKSDRFQKSIAPTDKKEKLKQMAASVADQDDILMIIK